MKDLFMIYLIYNLNQFMFDPQFPQTKLQNNQAKPFKIRKSSSKNVSVFKKNDFIQAQLIQLKQEQFKRDHFRQIQNFVSQIEQNMIKEKSSNQMVAQDFKSLDLSQFQDQDSLIQYLINQSQNEKHPINQNDISYGSVINVQTKFKRYSKQDQIDNIQLQNVDKTPKIIQQLKQLVEQEAIDQIHKNSIKSNVINKDLNKIKQEIKKSGYIQGLQTDRNQQRLRNAGNFVINQNQLRNNSIQKIKNSNLKLELDKISSPGPGQYNIYQQPNKEKKFLHGSVFKSETQKLQNIYPIQYSQVGPGGYSSKNKQQFTNL